MFLILATLCAEFGQCISSPAVVLQLLPAKSPSGWPPTGAGCEQGWVPCSAALGQVTNILVPACGSDEPGAEGAQPGVLRLQVSGGAQESGCGEMITLPLSLAERQFANMC